MTNIIPSICGTSPIIGPCVYALFVTIQKLGDFIPTEHISKLRLRDIKYLGHRHTAWLGVELQFKIYLSGHLSH